MVAAIVPALIAVTIWIVSASGGSSDDTSSSTDSIDPPLSSQPNNTLKLHTAAGFEKFVKATRSAFGRHDRRVGGDLPRLRKRQRRRPEQPATYRALVVQGGV